MGKAPGSFSHRRAYSLAEPMFRIGRNRRSPSTGTGVQDGPEYAIIGTRCGATVCRRRHRQLWRLFPTAFGPPGAQRCQGICVYPERPQDDLRTLRTDRKRGMARVVAVHGIGQQRVGPDVLRTRWMPALRDGMTLAHMDPIGPEDLLCAFYGDLFRPNGAKSVGDPPLDANDVHVGDEQDLLFEWWQEAASVDRRVPGPDADTKLRTPQVVQRALNALSGSRFFAGISERALIFDLKQVSLYLSDPGIRASVQSRVVAQITDETQVLVGHSLGSIVGYEAACAHPEWRLRAFVTLGSPLAIRNLIFDRLRPPPVQDLGVWPAGIRQWTNVADSGDIVALVKQLAPRFGAVTDLIVDNGATAHDVIPYLTAKETGRAIAAGLARES
jgi:hypothetical protein